MPQINDVVDPVDPTTWDVPDVLKPKPQQTVRNRRRPPTSTTLPKPPTTLTIQPQALLDTPDARLNAVASHPESIFVPAEVGLSVATSKIPRDQVDKTMSYLARETQLPITYFFKPNTLVGPQVTTYIAPNGTVVSAADAQHFVDKISSNPDLLRGILAGAVNQYDQNDPLGAFISTIPPKRRKILRSFKPVTVATASLVMRGLYQNLGSDRLANLSLESLIGASVQIAGRLKTPAAIELFIKNLAAGQGAGGYWSWVVAQAEEAAANGVSFTNQLQFIAFNNPAVQDQIRGDAALSIALREYQGRYFQWNPLTATWAELSYEEAINLASKNSIMSAPVHIDTPPSSWSDLAPDTPSRTGGTVTWTPNLDKAMVLQAGFVPGQNFIDVTRPNDYAKQAQLIAQHLEAENAAWANSPLGKIVGTVMKYANEPFQLAQTGFFKVVSWASDAVAWPVAYIATGFDAHETASWVNEYKTEMNNRAAKISIGQSTIGTQIAAGAHLPAWAGMVFIDLPSARFLDPFWVVTAEAGAYKAMFRADDAVLRSTTGAKVLKAFGFDNAALKLQEITQLDAPARLAWFTARFGDRGEELANWLKDVGARLDERAGLPLFGVYESPADKWRAFVELQLEHGRSYLGGKTLAEYMVDEAAAGGDVYARMNEKMRGFYRREAFHPQLVHNIETIVRAAEDAGNISREAIVNMVNDLLRSGLGGKAADLQRMKDIILFEQNSGLNQLRPGFQPQPITREVGVFETVFPNTVGDARLATTNDILAAQFPDTRRLVTIDVPAVQEVDTTYTRLALDEVGITSPGLRQFDMPRYSFAKGLAVRVVNSGWLGDTYLGHSLEAAFLGRIPEAVVGFEEGKFVENIRRRLIRSRVFSAAEEESLLREARVISEATNPTRETSMLAFLERLQRDTFDKIATEYGLGTNREIIWNKLHEQIQTSQQEYSKEAYNVSINYAADGSVILSADKQALLETQLLNGWYIADPIAMRRAVREAIGLHRSTEAIVANLANGQFLRPVEPAIEELTSSAERTIFQQQLDGVATSLKWDTPQRDFAAAIFDHMAMNALIERPDLYQTIDDFFRTIGTRYAKSASNDLAGLFQRLGEPAPMGDLMRLVHENPVGQVWHEKGGMALADAFPGTTTLRNGEIVSDHDLMAQLLAITSWAQKPEDNFKIALSYLMAYKRGEDTFVAGLRSGMQWGMLESIMDGSVMGRNGVLTDEWAGFLAQGKRMKSINFYQNTMGQLDAVTVDRRIKVLYGFSPEHGLTPKQYNAIADSIREVATATGTLPGQAQAALWTGFRDWLMERIPVLRAEGDLHAAATYQRLVDVNRSNDSWAEILSSQDGRALLADARSAGVMAPTLSASDPRFAGYLENIGRGLLSRAEKGNIIGAFTSDPSGVGGIINFFKGADPTTLVHESGHLLRSMLGTEDLAKLTEVYGIDLGDNWSHLLHPAEARAAEEAFAGDLVKFLNGKLVPQELKGIFAQVREFLARIWDSIRGKVLPTGDTIDPKLAEVFDKWFSRDYLPNAQGKLASLSEADLTPNVMAMYAKKSADWMASGYLRVWKPLMVLRPGYILRVPAFDEQIRFLIDAGLDARVQAQGIVGSLATRLADKGFLDSGMVKDVTYIPTRTGESLEVTRIIPGALQDDRYANSINASEIYQTFAEQADAVVNGAHAQYWGSVGPTEETYAAAWDTAVNGHLSTSVPGRIALRGVVEGKSQEEIAAELVTWATKDPEGMRIIQRIAPDDISGWADLVAGQATTYTLNQPSVALAAMRRQATSDMIDNVLETQYRAPGRTWLTQNEGTADRVLPYLDPAELDSTTTAIRGYLKGHGGGGTFDPTTGQFVEDGGYAVGIRDKTVVIANGAIVDDQTAMKAAIQEFLTKEPDLLRTTDHAMLGFWTDDAGKLHIDASVIIPDYSTAQGVAMLRDQEGIYLLKGAGVEGQYVDTISKPTVHGLLIEHATGSGVSPIRPITDAIGRKILQYPTNRLSRQPFFKAWYDRMMELQLELHKGSGFVPADLQEAERMLASFQANARRFALERVNRVMFNFADQSRIAELLHFTIPFMQPWQEAFSVYGHLLRKEPQLAAWVNRVFNTAVDAAFIKKDPDTGEWVIPQSNMYAVAPLMSVISHWPGMGLVSQLASFNLFFNNAFPINTPLTGTFNMPAPSLAPPVTWFLQQLVGNDQSRLSTWLYQYGGMSVKDMLPLPVWANNLITAVYPAWNSQGFTAYEDEFLRMSQMPQFNLKFANEQDRLDWAKSQAQQLYGWKTFISLFFPSAPRINMPVKAAEDYSRELIDKYANTPNGYETARTEFLKRYPDLWLVWQAKTIWQRQDPGLPGNFDTPPIPSTELADRILHSPGFKEFAAKFPGMAWAILPQEAYASGDYSPDIFQKQLASADRRYLSPEEFYAKGEAAAGWEAYWHLREWWDAKQEWMKAGNVSETNPEWTYWKDQYNASLTDTRRLFPSFSSEYGTTEEQLLDPRILAYARQLVKSKVFTNFPIGKGLAEYLKLRDGIRIDMAAQHITSIDSAAAIASGVSATYENGLNAIVAKYPEFQRAYDVFFSGKDLMAVRSDSAKVLDSLPEATRTQVFDWQRSFNDIQDQISLAPDALARNPLYNQESTLIGQAYASFPANANPVVLWYENLDYTTRQAYDLRVQTKSFLFLNEFERQYILKVPTDAATEAAWNTINATRTEIARRGKLEAGFSTAGAYNTLNAWIADQAKSNPVFAAQLQAANTWGWAFFQNNENFKQVGTAGDYWRALQTTVGNYQAAVEQAGLNGTGATEAPYNNVKQQLISYVQSLKAASPTFAAQWDSIETESSSDLIDTLMPSIWFRLGVVT